MGYIRGAVFTENNSESIRDDTCRLVRKMLDNNNASALTISAVFCTVTQDITALNPVSVIRQVFDFDNAAYMCFAEPHFDGVPSSCIRVCLIADNLEQTHVVHYYDGAAAVLRPDLTR